MPEAMERALQQSADSQGILGSRRAAYIYGAMRKAGWKPKHERKARKSRKKKA